jgi:transcriptional regulator of acetoin/glycerol metabolism
MRPPIPQATTEEHQPPPASDLERGRPVFLAVHPASACLPIPARAEIVGRAWLADAGVVDTKVSGQHVRLSIEDGRVHVEDQRSRNGTWIRGIQIPAGKRVALDDGAVLRLGGTLLVHRAAFEGALTPADPIGRLVGPWGLGEIRERLRALAERAGRTPKVPPPNVLIEGDSGTGKELVAAAVIHALGRARRPFSSLNVAAVAAGVFEAQLFGWVGGAYSGSGSGGPGVLRENEGGAVFLDEIGELPLELQPKLLRMLDNREVQPVGGRAVPVDVAIVAATNRPLEEAVARGVFRRDLHARFHERLALPSLAERPEDLVAILGALLARSHTAFDPAGAEVEAVERLLLEPWPANVRDLDRVAAALARPEPLTTALLDRVLGPRQAPVELTREAAEQMVLSCKGNEREAERRYRVSRGTLRRALGKGGRGT